MKTQLLGTIRNRVFKEFLLLLFLFSFPLVAEYSSPVLLIIGTRPEAIKMFPVYRALKEADVNTVLCTTGQHGEMVDEFLNLVNIKPDYEFKIMKQGQDLFYITESVLEKTKELIKDIKPSLVVVQGDTTTALASALAAFYLKIPIAHIEAGLRSGNINAPFPEELNRRWITTIASFHFAPTSLSVKNLENEGVKSENIFCTGNTVVDALYTVQKMIKLGQLSPSENLKQLVEKIQNNQHKIVLLTAHRRESLDGGIQNIFQAAKNSLDSHSNLSIIYPMHPNPLIKKIAEESGLFEIPNIHILPPLCYQDMVYLMNAVDGVMTDSGGIQEEAVSLCKPVLVLRNETDRPEGISDGFATLVGTSKDQIEISLNKLLDLKPEKSEAKISPYGDGHASQRITDIIKHAISKS